MPHGARRAVFAWLLLLWAGLATAQTTTGVASTGQSLFTSKNCGSCHAANGPTKANAINAGGHIAHANTQFMGGQADSTGTQFNDIAAYFATLFTDLGTQTVSFGSPSDIPIPNIVLKTSLGDYEGLRKVASPAHGGVTFTNLTATYTPAAGYCGSDSFTYEAYRTINTGTSNTRMVSLVVSNPSVPDISTSAGSIGGTQGSPISVYAPVSTGGPVASFALTGSLPTGLLFDGATGSISGTPSVSGNFSVTLVARNCFNGNLIGQSASKLISIAIAASGLPQATLNVTAMPNPVGYLNTSLLSTSGGSGNGSVSYVSGNGNCTISGATLTAQASSGTCTITATKAGDGTYQSATAQVVVTLLQGQVILFGTLPNKSISDPPFVVTAAGGASGSPVIFTVSGSCTNGGTFGESIAITGIGTCSVTANQAGNATYATAPPVTQSFQVIGAVDEIFPANCQMPAGWSKPAAAAAGWNVAFDMMSEGACSLKTAPLSNTGLPLRAETEFSGTFLAGNISFKYRTSFESGKGCFTMLVDGVVQAALGSCVSGINGFAGSPISVPITAGTHTVTWRYEKTISCCTAGYADAVWIDDVRMPLPLAPVILGPSTVNILYDDYLAYPLGVLYGPATVTLVSGAPPYASVSGGYLQGTMGAGGTYTTVLSASNAYGTTNKTITFNVAARQQFVQLTQANNKLTTAPPFTVSASPYSYDSSNNQHYAFSGPITFSTSGVCTASGDTITLTGAVGVCSITASQAGTTNYLPASSVPMDITVTTPAMERFPSNCVMPAGWTVPAGATTGWSVDVNQSSSDGACSLKSNPVPDSGGSAMIEYTGTFIAGSFSVTRRVSSDGNDCLYLFIDGAGKNLDGNCATYGIGPLGGEWPFNGAVPMPITAGTHTIRFEYRKYNDDSSSGEDAAWIDEVVLPQAILTVSKTGGGTGSVSSTPYGITCGGTCTLAMGGRIQLQALATAGSAFTGWAGGGCAGNGTCEINLSTNTTITANFILVSAPSAPLSVSATPKPFGATVSFSPPASNGGGTITQYTASCAASGQPTRSASGAASPLAISGLAGGVVYACNVVATNTGGTSVASAPASVTPTSLSFTGGVTSMMNHTAVGSAALAVDASIPVSGVISIDPRASSGTRTLRFSFDAAISSVSGATATNAAGAAIGSISAVPSGNDILVTLNNIPDGSRVKITLPVINGANLNVTASVGFFVGDVTGSGMVTAADIAAIKARIAKPVTSINGNARFDLNRDGVISIDDVSIAKALAGRRLP